MIEWAFAEYFKTGTFPPKPADITKLIRQKREAMITENRAPLSEEEWKVVQADRKGYFFSEEYKRFLAKMKAEHGI